jgi:hypothetical protein
MLRRLLSHPDNLQRFREISLQKAMQFNINRIVEQYEQKIFATK